MDVLTVLITLVVVGFVLWLINRIPMQSTIRTIVNSLVVVVVVIWILRIFGLWTYLSNLKI
jgi:hypothetical protein